MSDDAALEDVDVRASRGIDPTLIGSLASCEWIRRQQNLIINGATGVGKTWLACAFGDQACRHGLKVLFYRISDLYDAIGNAILDGSLPKLRLKLSMPSLLILDDFGMGLMTQQAAQVLLDVIDRRVKTGALLVTSQYPTGEWHKFFPNETLADAVLDRVVHQAHRLNLKGESLRKLRAQASMLPS